MSCCTYDLNSGDINNSGNSFIPNAAIPYDWVASGIDDNGSLRAANWSKIDGSSVCPIGYRVPTIDELGDETRLASTPVANSTTAFENFLKLPSAGSRADENGSLSNQGSAGNVWSSSANAVDDSASNLLFFNSSSGYTSRDYRANGYSVRCLKD